MVVVVLVEGDGALAVEVEHTGLRALVQFARQAVALAVGGDGAVGVHRVHPCGAAAEALREVGTGEQHHGRVDDVDAGADVVVQVVADALHGGLHRLLAHHGAAVVEQRDGQFLMRDGRAEVALVHEVAANPAGELLVLRCRQGLTQQGAAVLGRLDGLVGEGQEQLHAAEQQIAGLVEQGRRQVAGHLLHAVLPAEVVGRGMCRPRAVHALRMIPVADEHLIDAA